MTPGRESCRKSSAPILFINIPVEGMLWRHINRYYSVLVGIDVRANADFVSSINVVISVRVPESGVCVHISGEDWVWYVCDVLYAVLYVHANCFVVCGCDVSRRYIYVCSCDVFSVVNMYLDHVQLCVVCINGRMHVCCSECNGVSDECVEPTSCLV